MLGINNGMVMQRGTDNTCSIILQSTVSRAQYKPQNGEYFPADLTPLDVGCRLTGIPVGGPYSVRLDGEEYDDIYVGDVWILAGQSNMEGQGWLTPKDKADEGNAEVRVFRMNDTWDTAKHPLHEIHLAADAVHHAVTPDAAPHGNCVGPGLDFAKRLHKMLAGVPQGVISCAHGGTSMTMWSPELKDKGSDSLYGAMLRRFVKNGSNVRGMFWYQGCAETDEANHLKFTERMVNFVENVRSDFGSKIPIVQVQISRHTDNFAVNETWKFWNSIREQQRVLNQHIAGLATTAAISYAMDDGIHISGEDQPDIGKFAAEAMYNLIYGTDENGCLPPPEFSEFDVYTDNDKGANVVRVKYKNLHGSLKSKGRPTGFMLRRGTEYSQYIFNIKLEEDSVLLYTHVPIETLSEMEIFYGYGANPYCNITDSAGRPVPAMGPIII